MFDKILIANRGEIAMCIHRACREMGIATVAVHSTADAAAMHVRLADESVCIGPPPAQESYLNIPAIISAAEITNADAIHPGYGFLAENAAFAEIVEEHGFAFIGPMPEHIRLMGDKIAAKTAMRDLGVPIIPGSGGTVDDPEQAAHFAREVGYPIALKAVSGGGGKGMKVVANESEMAAAMANARAESKAAFGDDSLYVEKYLAHPRHIEIQIIADMYGAVVHLGERDCSIQRRHQKLIEEAPSPALNADVRAALGKTVVKAIKKLGYRGVGTVEFLYEDGGFYFLEMNTRLQVEHPVTEMVTGIDMVREQIRIAAGAPLGHAQRDIRVAVHSIECRITAENPETFTPSPGRITNYHVPGGLGVRVDSALYAGCMVPPLYDSLIAKVIVHGGSRNECLMRLRRALGEYVVDGIETTIPLHLRIVSETDYVNGVYDVTWLEELLGLSK